MVGYIVQIFEHDWGNNAAPNSCRFNVKLDTLVIGDKHIRHETEVTLPTTAPRMGCHNTPRTCFNTTDFPSCSLSRRGLNSIFNNHWRSSARSTIWYQRILRIDASEDSNFVSIFNRNYSLTTIPCCKGRNKLFVRMICKCMFGIVPNDHVPGLDS